MSVPIGTELGKNGEPEKPIMSKGPFYLITVTPYDNIQSGAEITVTVNTLTVYDGIKTYGHCEATTTFGACDKCEECDGYVPEIYAAGDTITAGGKQYLWVNSLGLACPPYEWSVYGVGYSLTENTTANDFDKVILRAETGTVCGSDTDAVAIISVIDSCGVYDSYKIRGPNGSWGNRTNYGHGCGAFGPPCGDVYANAAYTATPEIVIEEHRWIIGHSFGTPMAPACVQFPANAYWWDNVSAPLVGEIVPSCGSPQGCASLQNPTCAQGGPYAQTFDYYTWGCP